MVQVPGSWNFWSDRKRKFVAGPRKGESEVITKEEVNAYREQAESKFGRYIPAGLFGEPRFIPGTHRESLPLVDLVTGQKLGYIDKDGVHKYGRPLGPPVY